MANDMIAISANQLPAHLQKKAKAVNVFAAAVSSGGFPVVSIKGKVFHVQRGDERELVTKDDGDAAGSIEVVILATNPNKSKVYYAHGYEEGSSAAPDCYSNDGIAPASDAEDPQSKKCEICPHNQWGSRITESGGKGKACADSMRIAVAPAGQINDPMLIRVPAASLKTLGQYGAQLAKRGVSPSMVVTKVSFDHSVAYPSLTFKAIRFITEEEMAEVESTLEEEDDTISNITGTSGAGMTAAEAQAEAAPEPEPKKAKPKAAPKPEPEPEPEPTPEPEPEPKAAAKVEVAEEYDNIEEALDNLDFDD